MKLHERIKELRQEKNISQRELSAYLSVDFARISKWELNKQKPSYEDLIKMAQYFDVTVGYLLGVEDFK